MAHIIQLNIFSQWFNDYYLEEHKILIDTVMDGGTKVISANLPGIVVGPNLFWILKYPISCSETVVNINDIYSLMFF